ncbi:MAG: lamin tail domain-containing protein [Bacteroidota bacterium]
MLRLARLSLALCLLAPIGQAQSEGDVVVNEIAYDPASGGSANEWIEVVNRSTEAVDLGGLIVSDAVGSSDALAGSLVLEPGDFAVLVRDEAAFQAAYPGIAFVTVSGFPSLNNGGDTVSITLGAILLDTVPYLPSWGGADASLERRDPDGPSDDADNWTTTTDPSGGTPRAQNTAFEVDTTPPSLLSAEAESATAVLATFSEPLDPASAEDPSRYSFSDGLRAPTEAEVLAADPARVRLTLASPLPGLGVYTLTASGVADRAGNAMEPESVPFAFGEGAVPSPRDVVLNEFLYDEPSTGTPGEYVELFNRTNETFDLADFTLNDGVGADEPITTQPTPLGPGGYAVIVEDGALLSAVFPDVPFIEQPVWSALNNSGDALVLTYRGTVIDSLTYRPDWGGDGRSLERRDPDGPSTQPNFATTTDPRGGTPGALNMPEPPDSVPPILLGAEATSATTVLVTFDEPLDPSGAEVTANYTVSGGLGPPAQAALQDDPAQVLLTLSAPLANATAYTLTVSGVADAFGNVMVTASIGFFFGVGDAAAPRDLVFNEFLYDEPSADNPGEYIELFNRTEKVFDLREFTFNDAVGADVPVSDAPRFVLAGEYAVLVENGETFAAQFPDIPFVEPPSWSALNLTGDALVLKYQGTVIDTLFYRSEWGGEDASLERKDPRGPSSSASNWTTTTDLRGGTPGEINATFEPDATPPSLLSAEAESATVVIAAFSEPLDPLTAEDPSRYTVSPLGAPVQALLSDDPSVVRLTLGTPLPGLGTYTLTASGLTDLVGNAMDEQTATFSFGMGAVPQPRDLVLNEFLYDEPEAGSPGEFIELFNRTDETFDLADFTLADEDGDPIPLSDRQVLLGPEGYAVIVEDATAFAAVFPEVDAVESPGWNTLNNSGDTIVLAYRGGTVDSLTYTGAWGGVDASLERRDPRGPSSSASNWGTTTAPLGGTPGAINSQFALDVTGPQIVAMRVAASETELIVTLDEPADPASVSAPVFRLDDPALGIADATLEDDAQTIRLTLDSRLPTGDYALSAFGLADPLGNSSDQAFLFSFASDTAPPAIATASATDARTVRVVFAEAVRPEAAASTSTYSLDGVPPERVLLRSGDTVERAFDTADLIFSPAPPARQALTLRVIGITDLAGNTRDEASATVFFGDPDVPTAGDLAITEILFDPASGSDGEYVEVVNTTDDRLFDLGRLILADDPEDDDPISDAPVILGPGQFLALVADLETFRTSFPDAPAAQVSTFPGLGNGGDLVALLTEAGEALDSVRYDPDWHRVELEDATGISLERRSVSQPIGDPNNWSSSLDPRGGTPGETNSIATSIEPPSTDQGLSFSPDPFDAGNGQGTTISYVLAAPASLVRVRIFDGAGRQVRELEAARLSGAQGTLLWDGRDDRGERLRIGPYVVLLEAVDASGGTTEAHKGVVVLAREL